MISFFVTFWKLAKAIVLAAKEVEFQVIFSSVVILLIGGALFYRWAEHWSFLDALYFCMMTITTIGYGDLAPSTPASKIFTIAYSFLGIGMFVVLAARIASTVINYRIDKREKH